MEAPVLTIPELRQEVERIFRREHRSSLVALYGRGAQGEFELDGRRWQVAPTGCELELRERLPRPDDHRDACAVYLVDWTADVLPDEFAPKVDAMMSAGLAVIKKTLEAAK